MSSIDQQFVEFVVKSLVARPDAVEVTRRIDEKGVLLELTVDPDDLGRVIGKRGATAQSIRTLLRALGTKNDARYNLKIVDNGVGGGSGAADDDDAGQTGDIGTAGTDDRESDVVRNTRKELADLDDLDV
ncbi:MAG TPA: KH domain-containing protein [Candidatus Saccharimonadales bacterium]|nr:KH domain-containing protein [Candidatus Saccharimonadales bacterium]